MQKTLKFSDLRPGDIFEAEGPIYVKTENDSAVLVQASIQRPRLTPGMLVNFYPDAWVILIEKIVPA